MTPIGFAMLAAGGLAVWAGISGKNVVSIFGRVIGAAKPIGGTPAPASGSVDAPNGTSARPGRARPASLTLGDGSGPDVLGAAARYLGVPYVYGGTDPSVGLDCSGFVQRVYADLGIGLPRTSYEQANVGVSVPFDEAQPGDLLFFNGNDHVAIYTGGGRMVSADHPGTVVTEEPLWGVPDDVRRVMGTATGSAADPSALLSGLPSSLA